MATKSIINLNLHIDILNFYHKVVHFPNIFRTNPEVVVML